MSCPRGLDGCVVCSAGTECYPLNTQILSAYDAIITAHLDAALLYSLNTPQHISSAVNSMHSDYVFSACQQHILAVSMPIQDPSAPDQPSLRRSSRRSPLPFPVLEFSLWQKLVFSSAKSKVLTSRTASGLPHYTRCIAFKGSRQQLLLPYLDYMH